MHLHLFPPPPLHLMPFLLTAVLAFAAGLFLTRLGVPRVLAEFGSKLGRRWAFCSSAKARAASALMTDHERNAISARVPCFHLHNGADDAGELHGNLDAPGRQKQTLRTIRSPNIMAE